MTSTLPTQPHLQGDVQPLSPLVSLSTMSTLWIPLDETICHWATFAQEAFTVSALLAIGTVFYGLAWETKALRHYNWACHERERGRARKEAHWLERAVQDLDCALDQWRQALPGWTWRAMTSCRSQQRRSALRKQPLLHEMVWNDEQDGDTFIEDEDWPPRNHTSAIRYQNTNHGVLPGRDLVRTTTTKGRMQGVPARRSALLPQRTGEGIVWQSSVPLEREHPQSSPGRRGHLRLHWSLWMGLGMLVMTGAGLP